MWTYSLLLTGLASLLLYRREDFKRLSKKDIITSCVIFTTLLGIELLGWNETGYKQLEQSEYRLHVEVSVWLALTCLGLLSLKKQLQSNLNNNLETS